jgi:hypothetical protein
MSALSDPSNKNLSHFALLRPQQRGHTADGFPMPSASPSCTHVVTTRFGSPVYDCRPGGAVAIKVDDQLGQIGPRAKAT